MGEPAGGVFPVADMRGGKYCASLRFHRFNNILVAAAADQRVHLIRHDRHPRKLRGGAAKVIVGAKHDLPRPFARHAEYLRTALLRLGDLTDGEAGDEGTESAAKRDRLFVRQRAYQFSEHIERVPYKRLTLCHSVFLSVSYYYIGEYRHHNEHGDNPANIE